MDASDSPANPDFPEWPRHLYPAGRRQNARREDGTRWNYAYNNRSEVTGASKRTAANGQVPGLNFGYDYDGIGNRTKAWSGTAGTSGSPTWEYTSNALNQYTRIKHSGRADILTRSDGTVTATVTGATAGSVVTLDQFHAIPLTRSSTDDTHGRLSTTTVRRSGVNQSPLVTTWFPPATRVTGTGGKLAYDADGNLLTDGRWNYTWDGENRLVKMTPVILSPSTINGITTTTSATLTFAYDWMGRRIGKITEQGSGTTTMAYAYDHWNPVAEWLRPNVLTLVTAVTEASLQRTHLWGLDIGSSGRVSAGMRANFQAAGGVGGLIASTWHASSNPQNRYIPGYDANGNIISWSSLSGSLVLPSLQASLQRRDYDPFGNAVLVETMATGSVADNIPDFGFSTKLQDKQTGLYYYGYRYYDSVSGRWPSRDPIGENGGINNYAIVRNSPVSHFDFLGRQAAPPLKPAPPGLSAKHRSVSIQSGRETMTDGKIGYNVVIRHAIPSAEDSMQTVRSLFEYSFDEGSPYIEAVYTVDNFNWAVVNGGLPDGRGYIDDLYGVGGGVAAVGKLGRHPESLCELVITDDSSIGAATANQVQNVLDDYFTPNELGEFPGRPDAALEMTQNGEIAMSRIENLLSNKIQFGLKVTWQKGGDGQPDKEFYETFGELKK